MAYLSSTGTIGADSELHRLRVENRNLAEELAQCQSDKEFVWSLWKRLQVASPDITQAVGMVIQREKEKQEYKDRKVLEILQGKDDKINELQNLISTQGKELNAAISRKSEAEEHAHKYELEVDALRKDNERAGEKLREYDGFTRDKDHMRDDIYREFEDEIEELKRLLNSCETERDHLKKDKQDLQIIRDTQKERIQNLEDDLKDTENQDQDIINDLEEAKKMLRKYEKEVGKLGKDEKFKTMELENVRKELSELWQTHQQTSEHSTQQAGLIRQMQALQKDTQKMLKNQEEAFTLETSSLQKLYDELNNKYAALRTEERELKHQLSNKENIISNLKRQLEEFTTRCIATQATIESTSDTGTQAYEGDTELEFKIHGLTAELHVLKERLREKNRIIEDLATERPTRSRGPKRVASVSPVRSYIMGKGAPYRNAFSEKKAKNTKKNGKSRSASFSPSRLHLANSMPPTGGKHSDTEKKLEATRELLKYKTEELNELRQAHDHRLERLKVLQSEHKLLKKQLKMSEEELAGKPIRKKKLRRSDPKSLQQENSDSVWNELTFFRNENKNLKVSNMNLKEEVDTLRVQSSQDAATIHDLKICLEQEKEELQFLMEADSDRPTSTPLPDKQLLEDLKMFKMQSQDLTMKLADVQEELFKFRRDKDALVAEKNGLKGEVRALKQLLADKRMAITDLKQDLHRVKLETRRKEQKRKQKAKRTAVAKQYQKILNQSIKDMSGMFDDFRKHGYEDVSDSASAIPSTDHTQLSGDKTGLSTDHTATSGSLGTAIKEKAQASIRDEDGFETESTISHSASTLTQDTEADVPSLPYNAETCGSRKSVAKGTTPKTSRIFTRTTATSPIHFMGSNTTPKVVSKKTSVGMTSTNSSARQITTMKQRISSLQQQVSLLKTVKENNAKNQQEQKKVNAQLQEDFSNANHRMHAARNTIQRLTAELERCRREKELLEKQLEDSSVNTSDTQHTDAEFQSLQSRLRISTNEVSKQLVQIKQLKTENTEGAEKIQQLQDKLNHSERDVAQKRILVEDMKMRLKCSQENAKADADIMLEAEDKIRSLTEVNNRNKTQIDSFKTRLSAVSREKSENENKVLKLSGELEKKSKALTELQRKCSEFQSMATEIERTADTQLRAMAKQSETALSSTQMKLQEEGIKLTELDKFIKILGHALLNSIRQARSLLHQQENRRKSTPKLKQGRPNGLQKAEKRVCDILNISATDLDDLMSVHSEDDSEDEKDQIGVKALEAKHDKKWSKQLDKLTAGKADFAMAMVEHFMEKIEERNQLSAKLATA